MVMKALNIVDTKLDEILGKLIPEFQPTKVFLFGSRANGSAKEDSDYDLFLVVPHSDLTRRERMVRALELLWGNGVSVDVFIYTEQEFNSSKGEFNSISYTVANEGLELKVG